MGRYSSKSFSSLWNHSWNEKVDMEIIDRDFLSDLVFDQQTKRLSFIIRHYHREPKITRYVTSNYVRTPIYEDYSERTKIVKKFNKIINPICFVNQDILKLQLDKSFILAIIEKIEIIPEWRKKEIQLEEISDKIMSYQKDFRNFYKEKELYSFKDTNFQEYPSNFWLRFLLGFLTFFLSFLNFVSREQAKENQKLNEKNKKWNEEHKIAVDEKNKELLSQINEFNKDLKDKIEILTKEFKKIEAEEIQFITIDDKGWINLRDATNFSSSHLHNKKGVYIIWNQTKNKYYVGQSKHMARRLLQHFKDGEVKNILFAKDWYAGDQFVYRYYFCETKDELDDLEKRYIDEYNAFEAGYNSTNGNI
ncbi:MAG: GIY-YIG nuclease family protein [Spiroplasma sp.]